MVRVLQLIFELVKFPGNVLQCESEEVLNENVTTSGSEVLHLHEVEKESGPAS